MAKKIALMMIGWSKDKIYLKDIRMRKGMKVRMKRRKLATDPDVAFFMMTERRKVNMMMEVP